MLQVFYEMGKSLIFLIMTHFKIVHIKYNDPGHQVHKNLCQSGTKPSKHTK